MAFQTIEFVEIPENHPVASFFQFYGNRATSAGNLLSPTYDPLDIPHLLPWLMILDEKSCAESGEHHYRFVGTECVALLGVEMTGRNLGDEISDQAAQFRRNEFLEVKRTQKPSFSRAPIPIEGREFTEILCGVFPLKVGVENEDWQFHVIIARSTEWIQD